MKYFLITGGAGFLGTILKQSLVNDGAFVVSIDLVQDNYKNNNFIAIKGDIRNVELLNKICDEYKFDAIFHCASILAHDVKNKKELWTSNVEGTENIMSFSEKNECKKQDLNKFIDSKIENKKQKNSKKI